MADNKFSLYPDSREIAHAVSSYHAVGTLALRPVMELDLASIESASMVVLEFGGIGFDESLNPPHVGRRGSALAKDMSALVQRASKLSNIMLPKLDGSSRARVGDHLSHEERNQYWDEWVMGCVDDLVQLQRVATVKSDRKFPRIQLKSEGTKIDTRQQRDESTRQNEGFLDDLLTMEAKAFHEDPKYKLPLHIRALFDPAVQGDKNTRPRQRVLTESLRRIEATAKSAAKSATPDKKADAEQDHDEIMVGIELIRQQTHTAEAVSLSPRQQWERQMQQTISKLIRRYDMAKQGHYGDSFHDNTTKVNLREIIKTRIFGVLSEDEQAELQVFFDKVLTLAEKKILDQEILPCIKAEAAGQAALELLADKGYEVRTTGAASDINEGTDNLLILPADDAQPKMLVRIDHKSHGAFLKALSRVGQEGDDTYHEVEGFPDILIRRKQVTKQVGPRKVVSEITTLVINTVKLGGELALRQGTTQCNGNTVHGARTICKLNKPELLAATISKVIAGLFPDRDVPEFV